MRKIRRCPECKSDKGFSYRYNVNGYGNETRDFKGNVILADRQVQDSIISYSVVCANCGCDLDINKLEI